MSTEETPTVPSPIEIELKEKAGKIVSAIHNDPATAIDFFASLLFIMGESGKRFEALEQGDRLDEFDRDIGALEERVKALEDAKPEPVPVKKK